MTICMAPSRLSFWIDLLALFLSCTVFLSILCEPKTYIDLAVSLMTSPLLALICLPFVLGLIFLVPLFRSLHYGRRLLCINVRITRFQNNFRILRTPQTNGDPTSRFQVKYPNFSEAESHQCEGSRRCHC